MSGKTHSHVFKPYKPSLEFLDVGLKACLGARNLLLMEMQLSESPFMTLFGTLVEEASEDSFDISDFVVSTLSAFCEMFSLSA